jgi:hypothetical protein
MQNESEFLNLFSSASQMISEFSDIALVNYNLMKLVQFDRVDELVDLEHYEILKNTNFGRNFISFLNFYKIMFDRSNLIQPYSEYQNFDSILNLLRTAISSGNGFSFIRIGDGEGCFNAREYLLRNNIAELSFSHFENEVLIRQVGFTEISDELRLQIYSDLTDAIKKADCCGGFSHDDEIRCFELNKYSNELNFFESYIGFLCTRFLLRQGGVECIYTTANTNILFSFDNILKIISMVDLTPVFIGPVNISHLFLNVGGEFIQVPPRHLDKNIYDYGGSFPPLFFSYKKFISENINPLNCKERIFFVSGGMSGKLICNAIKINGGVAIDIGSATDYLAGYVSRS